MVNVGMTGFGASSLDHEVQFDVHTENLAEVFDTQARFCLDLLGAFAEAGIAFAYPTQVSFTAAPDGTMVMPYAATPPAATS